MTSQAPGIPDIQHYCNLHYLTRVYLCLFYIYIANYD